MDSSSNSHVNKSLTRMVASSTKKVELNWAHVIHQQIINVTSAMRKNIKYQLNNQNHYASSPAASPMASTDSSSLYNYCSDFTTTTGHNPILDNLLAYSNSQTKITLETSESPLLLGLSRLKARVSLLVDLRDLEPSDLLEPFLQIIKSGDTTGPITGTALDAIEKFIKYKILDPNHPNLPIAMSSLTHSVTHCKFEATDSVSDEIILDKILRLLRVIVTSEAGGKSLDDKGVCEMIEAAFGMCFQGRVSELLRRSAEQSLLVLVKALFERLISIMQAKEYKKNVKKAQSQSEQARRLKRSSTYDFTVPNRSSPKSNKRPTAVKATEDITVESAVDKVPPSPTISLAVSPPSHVTMMNEKDQDLVLVGNGDLGMLTSRSNSDLDIQESSTSLDSDIQDQINQSEAVKSTPEKKVMFEPFGLPAVLELIRVLVSLIDPRNRQHTDSMHRRVALSLMSVAIEIGGTSLSQWILLGANEKNRTKQERSIKRESAPAGKENVTNASNVTLTLHVDIHNENEDRSNDRKISISPEDQSDSQLIEFGGAGATLESIPGVSNEGEMNGNEPSITNIIKEANEGEAPAKNILHKPPVSSVAGSSVSEDGKLALIAEDLITNELCKFLFQILQVSQVTFSSPPSATTLTLLGSTLNLITSLFQTMREHLRLQQEWLLSWMMTKLDSGLVGWDVEEIINKKSLDRVAQQQQSLPDKGILVGEVREMILECLGQFSRIPTFMVDLYVYCDGDLSCQTHLFENLMRFLAKNVFPDATPGGPVTNSCHQSITVDSLLYFLKHMLDRRTLENDDNYLASEKLIENKVRKRILLEGAERFNKNHKDGVAFLQKHNFLPTPVDPHSLAQVLKYTPGINKTLLGEYVSKRSNLDLLKAFMADFDFKGKRIDEALRLLLESFRLPGESQLIERVMEVFAETYYNTIKRDTSGKVEINSQDATFVLAYSVIMLNTDQHNPQVRRRMTLEDFQRNTRGVNDGKNFDPRYMKQIYQEIKENEIVMPEEHAGDLGFNYAWRELMKRSSKIPLLYPCRTNLYDKDMYFIIWRPVLAAISYAFDSAEDELSLQKAIVGFHHCALIASHYNHVESFDSIIISLSNISGLLLKNSDLNNQQLRRRETLSDTVGKVDHWVVAFGNNYKGQLAAILMFSLVNEFGNVVNTGWRSIIDCVRSLFLHSLLPNSLVEVEDFIQGKILLQKIFVDKSIQEKSKDLYRNEGNGIFSTLSQLLSLTSNDEEYDAEPTTKDVEASSIATECIRKCQVDNLFLDSRFLEERALKILISSIIDSSKSEGMQSKGLSNSETPLQEISETDENGTKETSNLIQQNVNGEDEVVIQYNSASGFLLELLINIAIQNRDRIQVVWPTLYQHLIEVLKNSTNPMLLQRVVVGLFRLVMRLSHNDEIVVEVFKPINALRKLPQETFNLIAEKLMAGFLEVVKSDWKIFTNHERWETIMLLMAKTSMHLTASKYSFEVITFFVSETSTVLTAENFGECVDLLISFAAAAASANNSDSSNGGMAGDFNAANNNSPRSIRKDFNAKSGINNTQASNGLEQAIKALEKLFKLHLRIEKLTKMAGISSERAWFEFWLPILSGLGQQCYHPSREVRQCALTLLQRALLLPQLETITLDCAVDCFDHILFHLLDELLKPEVWNLDIFGMSETRMRACGLLCKIFLHYLPRLMRSRELARVWSKILQYIYFYTDAGGEEFLREGVQESLKNMLLVMSSQKVFQSSDAGIALWELTWKEVSKFLPNLKTELFPNEQQAPAVEMGSSDVSKPELSTDEVNEAKIDEERELA